MSNLDLSLDGILDERWHLEEIGEGKIKLCYNSVKGIPSVTETKIAIQKLLEEKGLSNVYISGENGDVMVTSESVENYDSENEKDLNDETKYPDSAFVAEDMLFEQEK